MLQSNMGSLSYFFIFSLTSSLTRSLRCLALSMLSYLRFLSSKFDSWLNMSMTEREPSVELLGSQRGTGASCKFVMELDRLWLSRLYQLAGEDVVPLQALIPWTNCSTTCPHPRKSVVVKVTRTSYNMQHFMHAVNQQPNRNMSKHKYQGRSYGTFAKRPSRSFIFIVSEECYDLSEKKAATTCAVRTTMERGCRGCSMSFGE
jgi:hypothetical protein